MAAHKIILKIHFKVSSQYNADYGKDKMFDGIFNHVDKVWHPKVDGKTPRVELNFKVDQYNHD